MTTNDNSLEPSSIHGSVEQVFKNEGVSNELSSDFQKELHRLSGNNSEMDASFLVGKVVIPSLKELQDLIEEYFIKVNQFSASQRFFLYGYLSGIPKESEIRSALHSKLDSLAASISQTERERDREELQDRVNILKFLLRYSEHKLASQHIMPPALEDDLKTLDFAKPSIVQNSDGSWNDFVGIHSQTSVIPGKEFGELVSTAYSEFALGEFCGWDRAFEGECITDGDVFQDAMHLFDDSELLPGMNFTDVANFVWAVYWYPKFLLFAYANPSNVFVNDLKCDFVTHWQAGYETEIGIAPDAPRDLVQILRFTPRLLTLLSSTAYSAIYEDGNDAFINLFPALKLARPEATQADIDVVIVSYLEKANLGDSTNLLGNLLDIDLELTEFFELVSACLHTKNSELLAQLAEIEDEITQVCVLLNPVTSVEVLEDLEYTYELPEGVKLETGYLEDGTSDDLTEFPNYISDIALRCHDFEFAEAIKQRVKIQKN